jgi:DNA-binding CsgD family transcriptional regulator
MPTLPGTIIFDLNGQLLYFNPQAISFLPILINLGNCRESISLFPPEILRLYQKTRDRLLTARSGIPKGVDHYFWSDNTHPLILRSFPLGIPGRGPEGSHIIILMDLVEAGEGMDLKKAAQRFQLSRREIEVLELLCRGMANRAIGEALYITRDTVKDHVAHIMRKMGVSSRNQVLLALYHSSPK